jgi:hypothetical protein
MWQTPFTGSDNGVWKDNSSDSTETGNLMLYGNYGHAVVLDAGEEVLGEPANKEVTIVVADSSADFSIDMGFTVSQESCYLICDVVPAPNGDGQVTNADISYMINTLNGTEVDPPGTAHSGDCIVNGVVTSSDYNVCLQFRN